MLYPTRGLSLVVGGFDNHLDVVGVRFFEACRRNPDKFPTLLELVNRGCPGVEHRLTQTPQELIHHGAQRPAIGNLALNALGDELLVARDIRLEVAVPRIGGFLTPSLESAE